MEEITADWTSLPDGVSSESLWVTLHDGCLESLHSDLTASTISVSILVDYVVDFHNLPKETRFVLKLDTVTSVRADSFHAWPPAPVIPTNATGLERVELMRGYHPKWRRQSVDWDSLEKRLQGEDVRIDIMDAEIAQHSNQVGLRLEGMLVDDHGSYHFLFIHAGSISFSDSNGGVYNLDQFLELGGRYWEAFGNHSTDNSAA